VFLRSFQKNIYIDKAIQGTMDLLRNNIYNYVFNGLIV